jgi:chromate transport protein ChrA
MDNIVAIFQEDPGKLIVVVAIVGGLLIAATSMLTGMVVQIAKTAERERSRREIAAYVAEGSITPEVAERLMAAGKGKGAGKAKSSGFGSCC